MADIEDDGFNEDVFKGLEEAPAPAEKEDEKPPVEPPKEDPKPNEEPPKEDSEGEKPPVEEPPKEGEEGEKPPETPPVEPPKEPETPEAPQPLTKDDVTAIISNLRNEERNSGKEVEEATQDVLDAYYPDGLSNTLVDEQSGKELRTPQDVVDASGGEMTIEQGAQWLLNEQYKLDNSVAKIKEDARNIAETTVKFKRDATTVLDKYAPLFKEYPHLQDKVYQKLMKQVKVDKERNVILSAPDVIEHYDDYLEPYQMAFEQATNKPATNPTPPVVPDPPQPTAEDRMDESGDGGQSPVDDPNDFAQQVSKELAKGF